MMINRRAVVAGVALTIIAPIPDSPARQPSAPAGGANRVVFRIDGWSAHDADANIEEAWIRIGHGWRTSWR
jgi:hypothetical protein